MYRAWTRAVALAVITGVVFFTHSDCTEYQPEQPENGTLKVARRSLQSCDKAQLQARMQEVEAVCCDEVEEECSSGFPTRCNPGCSVVFLPVRYSLRSLNRGYAEWVCVDNRYVLSAQASSRMNLRCYGQSSIVSKKSVRQLLR